MPDIVSQIGFAVLGIIVVAGAFGAATSVHGYIDEATRAKRAQADAYDDIGKASLIAAKAYANSLLQQAKGQGGGDG